MIDDSSLIGGVKLLVLSPVFYASDRQPSDARFCHFCDLVSMRCELCRVSRLYFLLDGFSYESPTSLSEFVCRGHPSSCFVAR